MNIKYKNSIIVNKIMVFLIVLYSFGYIFVPQNLNELFLLTGIVLLLLPYIYGKKIKLYHEDFLFALFLVIYLIGITYTSDIENGTKYIISFFTILVIKVLLVNIYGINGLFLKLTTVIALISISTIILHPIYTDSISNIRDFFTYSPTLITSNIYDQNHGLFGGIFPDRAAAAYFSAIGVFLGVHNWLKHRNMTSVILILAGIIAIILTGKRGPLFSLMLALIIYFYIFASQNLRLRYRIILPIVIIITIISIGFTDIGQVMYERIFDDENISSGRLQIYQLLFDDILERPFFGFGTGSTTFDLGIGGHNVYLTILRENGIFGLLFYILAIALILFRMILSKNIKFISSFYILTFLYFLIYSMTGNPLYDNYILFFTMISLSLYNSLHLKKVHTQS